MYASRCFKYAEFRSNLLPNRASRNHNSFLWAFHYAELLTMLLRNLGHTVGHVHATEYAHDDIEFFFMSGTWIQNGQISLDKLQIFLEFIINVLLGKDVLLPPLTLNPLTLTLSVVSDPSPAPSPPQTSSVERIPGDQRFHASIVAKMVTSTHIVFFLKKKKLKYMERTLCLGKERRLGETCIMSVSKFHK